MAARNSNPRFLLALVTGLLVAAAGMPAARAAGDPEVLFEDDFSTFDPTLGFEDETLGVRDNTLFRELDQGFMWRTFYDALVFENIDVAIQVRVKDFASQSGDAIGLAFWASSLDDFYTIEISDSGTFAIFRRVAGKWRTCAPWRPSDAIKAGAGVWNELRVVASGNRATAYINGKEVAVINGHPPEGGSYIGFYYESARDGSVGEFSKLKVVESPEPAKEETTDPNVLLADDFATLDPNLGVASDTFGVRDNSLFRQIKKDYYWPGIYYSEVFENIDATVNVRLQDFMAERNSKIGLMFWATAPDAFYLFEVSDSGTYAIFRRTPEGWFVLSRWRNTDAINVDLEAWNELRVVTSGSKATVFLNGQELTLIKGRPPEGGSHVGLFFETAEEEGLGEFSALKVLRGPEPPANDPGFDPNVLLVDHFSSFDPGWGSEQGWFGVKDDCMFIDFEAQQSYTALYGSDSFEEIDAVVNVRTITDASNVNGASGLVFWTDGGEDLYLLVLFSNGQIMVTRRIKGELKQPLDPQPLPAEAKFDPAGWTKLRLVTAGNKATIYANDIKIATISGQPPKRNFRFGFWGQSMEKPSRSEFSKLTIHKP